MRITERARQLRNNPTRAERLLWGRLRRRQLDGYRFRRQFVVGNVVIDFACPQLRLAIEVDGPYHDEQSRRLQDQGKEAFLRRQGYRLLRLHNSDIELDLDAATNRVRHALRCLEHGLRDTANHVGPMC